MPKDQIIDLWSRAPILKESNSSVLSKLCSIVPINSLEQIIAAFILDKKGKPICIRTYPEIKNDSIKNEIIQMLFQLEFEPAIGDKNPVISHCFLIINNKKCEMYKSMNKHKRRKVLNKCLRSP